MLTETQLREAFSSTNTEEPLAGGWPGLERYGRLVEQIVIEQNSIQEKVQSDYGNIKVPIGIMPEKLWRESRMWDLISCLARFHESKESQPYDCGKWLEELRRLLHDILYMSE